ncbi:DNA-binding transcriptional regulator, HxlR family [Brevibacterium sandarakinum]|uniref:DNA-binding transcriptional regulator, HxlR family n=1 Tax=Brevibacterium sandarakinum TaxID=629680 RepID=A0A1H1X7W8_BRESA|nr:helix-turn-helix domain-containing protein [Brevibacterium sandarakinum]SDT05388.1 DNA-binding transcriptional regulator, HxlR family [Brevibacterium sandarakinum]
MDTTAETTSDSFTSYCGATVRRAIDLIGGKWTMLILWELLDREHRYAELQRRVAGISQKVLSSELKSLVSAGLVEREVTPTVPPQVTYRITAEGRSLDDVFAAIDRWGHRHR